MERRKKGLASLAIGAICIGLLVYKDYRDRDAYARAVFDPIMAGVEYTVVSSGDSQGFWTICLGAVISFDGSLLDLQQPPQSMNDEDPLRYSFGGEWHATPADPHSLHLCQQEFNHFDAAVADALIAASRSDSAWYATPTTDTFVLWAPEQGLAARIYFGD